MQVRWNYHLKTSAKTMAKLFQTTLKYGSFLKTFVAFATHTQLNWLTYALNASKN